MGTTKGIEAVHPLIRQHRVEIAELCRQYRVRRLDVFGSAARARDFDAQRSDVDFLVDFHPEPVRGYARNYFEFQEALERLLDRPVELVTAGSIQNPFFLAGVEKSREHIYGA